MIGDVSHIADSLGRKALAAACGVTRTAVDAAVHRKRFPASWYLVVKGMCDRRGIECPASAFKMVSPKEGE